MKPVTEMPLNVARRNSRGVPALPTATEGNFTSTWSATVTATVHVAELPAHVSTLYEKVVAPVEAPARYLRRRKRSA